MRLGSRGILCSLILGSVGLQALAASLPTLPAKPISAFTLRDYRGKQVSLTDFADKKAVVVAFLGNECPLAKLYAPRLESLAKEFGPKGVAFIGVNANTQDSMTELAAFARQHEISFPVLKDLNNVVADEFTAQRTPEVFLLDAKRQVRYRGRIDDQYGIGSNSGYAKPKLRERNLANAIEEVLAGKTVSVPVTPATGCFIGRVPKVKPHGDVTYSRQIARIIQNRCVECHRPGEIAPFPMTSYDEVVGWSATIREVVDQQRMPPWFANPDYGHFANDARLTDEEKRLIAEWVDNGSPEGNPSDLPKPRSYAEGWRIPQPDQVVYMSDKPYNVPAEGTVAYQYFTADPGFKEDKWIQAVEARPGNRGVVHHIIVFAVPPGSRDSGAFGDGRSGFAGYAPGEQPRIYAPGTALRVPAGSKLLFQLHYTPNGTATTDLSCVGFKFADPKTVKRPARGGAAINAAFVIPPGAGNHEVTSRYTFMRDQMITYLFPHMHLRGKAFRFEVKYPDGRSEILLDVPKYDFNWQLRYDLAEPKLMPKGTVLTCTAHFDNSEENLANPDPRTPVRWGPQTWEEMMIGFFGTIPTQDQDITKLTRPSRKPKA